MWKFSKYFKNSWVNSRTFLFKSENLIKFEDEFYADLFILEKFFNIRRIHPFFRPLLTDIRHPLLPFSFSISAIKVQQLPVSEFTPLSAPFLRKSGRPTEGCRWKWGNKNQRKGSSVIYFPAPMAAPLVIRRSNLLRSALILESVRRPTSVSLRFRRSEIKLTTKKRFHFLLVH